MKAKPSSFQGTQGRFTIHASIQELGADLLLSLWGGTRPHIGAVGMAVPRPSLKDPKTVSATSSNFTFVGHKEDLLVKRISERLAAALNRNVVVVAGIHWDDITPEEIKTIEILTANLSDEILKRLKSPKKNRK